MQRKTCVVYWYAAQARPLNVFLITQPHYLTNNSVVLTNRLLYFWEGMCYEITRLCFCAPGGMPYVLLWMHNRCCVNFNNLL